MLRRTSIRLAAGSLTLVVTGMAAAPSFAASEVAKGTATAVRLSIAGTPADSGTYTASNDGTKETTSGNSTPPLSALGGQQLISGGILAQLAKTTVRGNEVDSVACAGLAGQGASVAEVGSATCLSGGQTLALNAGNLDLSKVTLSDSDLSAGLISMLGLPAGTDLSTVTGPLGDAIASTLKALGNPEITLNASALQASCSAMPRSADGSSDLGTTSLDVVLPQVGNQARQTVSLASFDAHPAPNTPIDQTPSVLVDALTKSFQAGLASANLPAIPGLNLDNTKVLSDALSMLTAQAGKAGFDQLVSGTLNKQARTGASSIEVTALDLNVLPAASAVSGGSGLAGLQVGDVTCSAGTVDVAPVVKTSSSPKPNKVAAVPVAVDSGLSGDEGSDPFLPVLGGLMLLTGAGVGVRRVLRSRG